jgi:hypothetical protein
MATSTIIHWPNTIKVNGFGFMHQGWNNFYTKVDIEGKEIPMYEMKSYLLYGLFPIYRTYIKWNDMSNQWIMYREHDKRVFNAFDEDHPIATSGIKEGHPLDILTSKWLPSSGIIPVIISI